MQVLIFDNRLLILIIGCYHTSWSSVLVYSVALLTSAGRAVSSGLNKQNVGFDFALLSVIIKSSTGACDFYANITLSI